MAKQTPGHGLRAIGAQQNSNLRPCLRRATRSYQGLPIVSERLVDAIAATGNRRDPLSFDEARKIVAGEHAKTDPSTETIIKVVTYGIVPATKQGRTKLHFGKRVTEVIKPSLSGTRGLRNEKPPIVEIGQEVTFDVGNADEGGALREHASKKRR